MMRQCVLLEFYSQIVLKIVNKTEVAKIELDTFLPREIAVLQKISIPLDIY